MASILALLAATLAFSYASALSFSDPKPIGEAIINQWVANSPDSLGADGSENFAIEYAAGKVYLISRHASALSGGIVSILDRITGNWTHKVYNTSQADNATYRDNLFVLGDRVFMLINTATDAIRFPKLFYFDDDQGAWVEVAQFTVDPLASEPLIRGNNMVLIEVPDQSGTVAYVGAIDLGLAANDSAASISALTVTMAGGKPASASLKRIARLVQPMASAIVSLGAKDDKLYAFVGNFANVTANSTYVPVTVKVIDLKSGNEVTPAPVLPSTPVIDYMQDRAEQFKDKMLFLGQSKIVGDKQLRHAWRLDLGSMKVDEADGSFPNVPNRVFGFDQTKGELYAAGLKMGVFAILIGQ